MNFFDNELGFLTLDESKRMMQELVRPDEDRPSASQAGLDLPGLSPEEETFFLEWQAALLRAAAKLDWTTRLIPWDDHAPTS